MIKKITLSIVSLLAIGYASAQDTCATAVALPGAGLYVVSAVNGTQVPSPLCANTNGTGATAGEWYTYTATGHYNLTVTTDIANNNPRIDTRFHVYTGSCAALTCYSGDDDSGTSYSSVKTFEVLQGETYYITFDNRWSSLGFTFQLIESPYVAPPPTPITYTNTTLATMTSSYNMCVVDMNNDGLDDIVGVSANNLKVHYQTATAGTFNIVDYPVSGTNLMPTWSLAAGDYNKDGLNDLVLGNGSGATFWKSTGSGYTSYSPGNYIFSQRTNFHDINNDGNLDAFVCHDINPNVYYLNDGSGNLIYYQSTVTPGAMSLGAGGGNYASIWFDYDNDGDSDMFISKCSGPPCELHRNDGNGVFTNVSAQAGINFTPVQSWSSAIDDFDNDGDMDILIGRNGSSTTSRLFKNNSIAGNGIEEPFTDITSGSGWDNDAANYRDYVSYDFDNDGKVDVMSNTNKIMFNLGNNFFSPVTYSTLGFGSVGDLNNDGFLDIQHGNIISYGVPNGNNWIVIKPKGVQSNSNGIGARITIDGPWGTQIRDVRSGVGFAYMSTLNAHFGLGTNTVIDQLTIQWPSGTVDTISNPSVNQSYTVVEGSTVMSTNNNALLPFTVYPNPAKDILNIAVKDGIEIKQVAIFDLNGRLIQESQLNSNNTIKVDKLSSGIYLLKVTDSNNAVYSQKISKE